MLSIYWPSRYGVEIIYQRMDLYCGWWGMGSSLVVKDCVGAMCKWMILSVCCVIVQMNRWHIYTFIVLIVEPYVIW